MATGPPSGMLQVSLILANEHSLLSGLDLYAWWTVYIYFTPSEINKAFIIIIIIIIIIISILQ